MMFVFFIISLLIFHIGIDCLSYVPESEQFQKLQVRTLNGLIQGAIDRTDSGVSYFSFMGIPYAVPPLGELRFRDPQPMPKWSKVLDARTEGPCCIGISTFDLKDFKIVPSGSEDCLYLSVFTPKINEGNSNDNLLPVLVYIVGGAFLTSCTPKFVFGPDYFIENGVVIVTFNFRTTMFGYLSTEDLECPGNWAIKDQIAALNWIKHNIHNFGGDPNKITLIGQSAGAASINLLLMSPKAEGLFQGVIMQSGSSLCPWSYQISPRKMAFDIGFSLGIETNSSKELVSIFRKMDIQELMRGQIPAIIVNFAQVLTNGFPFSLSVEPHHENAVITDYTYNLLERGNFTRVPVIMGVNSLEMKYLKIFVDIIGMPVQFLADISPGSLIRFTKSTIKRRIAGMKIRSHFSRSDEFVSLTSEELIQYLSGDMYFRPMRKTATLLAKKNPVYFYVFSYEGELAKRGASLFARSPSKDVKGVGHTEEIFYQFKTNFTGPVSIRDQTTINRFMKLWINFAKTGNPTPAKDDDLSAIIWPRVSSVKFPYLDIGAELKISDKNFDEKNYRFWEKLYQQFADKPYKSF
ncbi:carboxylesterase 4A-like [Cylas formicarius]|uniref:carboxylesterase 4A-like n=1 Tax=Cylas formicarius TaxID=197179 RepID=UPI002958B058|nr:carboxylesterase 4A-like [Cylas formicarius]